jgi:hypothetical protein
VGRARGGDERAVAVLRVSCWAVRPPALAQVPGWVVRSNAGRPGLPLGRTDPSGCGLVWPLPWPAPFTAPRWAVRPARPPQGSCWAVRPLLPGWIKWAGCPLEGHGALDSWTRQAWQSAIERAVFGSDVGVYGSCCGLLAPWRTRAPILCQDAAAGRHPALSWSRPRRVPTVLAQGRARGATRGLPGARGPPRTRLGEPGVLRRGSPRSAPRQRLPQGQARGGPNGQDLGHVKGGQVGLRSWPAGRLARWLPTGQAGAKTAGAGWDSRAERRRLNSPCRGTVRWLQARAQLPKCALRQGLRPHRPGGASEPSSGKSWSC